MKKFFALALLVFTTTAFAGIPHVWNNGSTVTFDYWNSSDRDERCSGPIYLELEDGSRDTIHVYEYVWRRGSVYRTYFPNTVGQRIERVSHAVWCW